MPSRGFFTATWKLYHENFGVIFAFFRRGDGSWKSINKGLYLFQVLFLRRDKFKNEKRSTEKIIVQLYRYKNLKNHPQEKFSLQMKSTHEAVFVTGVFSRGNFNCLKLRQQRPSLCVDQYLNRRTVPKLALYRHKRCIY